MGLIDQLLLQSQQQGADSLLSACFYKCIEIKILPKKQAAIISSDKSQRSKNHQLCDRLIRMSGPCVLASRITCNKSTTAAQPLQDPKLNDTKYQLKKQVLSKKKFLMNVKICLQMLLSTSTIWYNMKNWLNKY